MNTNTWQNTERELGKEKCVDEGSEKKERKKERKKKEKVVEILVVGKIRKKK
jgi:hypothetical protein